MSLLQRIKGLKKTKAFRVQCADGSWKRVRAEKVTEEEAQQAYLESFQEANK